MTVRICSTCRFAHGYAHPGNKPEIQPKPEPHWLWGEEDNLSRWNREAPLRLWGFAMARYEQMTRCRRFPEEVKKSVVDACGEWLA